MNVLISADDIQLRVRELAQEIRRGANHQPLGRGVRPSVNVELTAVVPLILQYLQLRARSRA